MKKHRILSRLLCGIMVLLLALEPVLPARALDEGDVDEDVCYVQSNYVGFAVKREGEYSGRFTIGNVEGNPDYASDNEQILLFGHPKPWSSFTTVRLDGEPIIFGSDILSYSRENRSVSAEMEALGVKVTQTVALIHNPKTGLDDTVQISYRLESVDEQTHEADLRILLDTMLGYNDGAPFKVPGLGDVTTEKDLISQSINPRFGMPTLPSFYQAYDDLDDAQVFAVGTLRKRDWPDPDRVTFANWTEIYDESQPWDYVTDPDTAVTGDSAVAIWWEGREIAPGAPVSFATWYGVGCNDSTASVTDATVLVPEDCFAVIAVDEDVRPVSGVKLTALDLPGAPSVTTDKDGVAIFPALAEPSAETRIRASRSDLHTTESTLTVRRGTMYMVRVFPNDGLPHLTAVTASLEGKHTDLLLEDLCLRACTGSEREATNGGNLTDCTLQIAAIDLKESDTIELIQADRVVARALGRKIALTVFNGPIDKPGAFGPNLRVKGLSSGEPVYIRVVDEGGSTLLQKPVALRISEPIESEKDEENTVALMGDKLKLTVPADIPIIGGDEIELGFDRLPVEVEIQPNNTVRVALNPIYESAGATSSGKTINWNATKEAFAQASQPNSFWDPPGSHFNAGIGKVSAKVSGYAEGTLGPDGSVVLKLGVYAEVAGSASHTFSAMLGYVPVYVAVSGELSLPVHAELQTRWENGNILVERGEGGMEPTFTFIVDGGVGVHDLLSVGASGHVSITWLCSYGSDSMEFYNKVYGRAGLSLFAQALGFRLEHELAEVDFDLWEDGPSPARRSAQTAMPDLYDTAAYTPIPRTQAGESLRGSWHSCFAADIYPDARPKLIRAGAFSYLFWLGEDEKRPDPDRMVLTYSVCGDWGNWSDPVQILPTGSGETADLDFDAVWDGSAVQIALCKANRSFSSDALTMEDVAKASEVWLLKLTPDADGALGAARSTQITTDEAADLTPRIWAEGNTTWLAWVQNRMEDGLFGKSTQTVCLRQLKGGEGFTQTYAPQGLVRALAVGKLGGSAALVWVDDTDRDYHTQDDTRLTIQAGSRSRSLALPGAAQPILAEGVLHYGSQDGPMTLSGLDEQQLPVFPDGVPATFGGSFAVLSGDGARKLLWTAAEDGSTQLWGVTAQADGWTGPYLSQQTLWNHDGVSSSLNGYLYDGKDYLALMEYYDGTKGADLAVVEIEPETVLRLAGVDYDPAAAIPGGTMPVTIQLANDGELPAEGMWLEDDQAYEYALDGNLAPGATTSFRIPAFPVPEDLEPGQSVPFSIQCRTEGGSNLAMGELVLGRTDLAVEAKLLNLDGREWVQLCVENLAAQPADGIVRLMSDSPTGAILFETRLREISPDVNQTILLDLGRLRGDMQQLDTFYAVISARGMEDCNLANNSALVYTAAGKPVQYALYLRAEGGGSIADSPESTHLPGTQLELSAKAEPGWRFDHWTLEGAGTLSDPADPNARFTTGAGSATLTAVFHRVMPFVDVPDGAYYEQPVLWAVEREITAGTDKTHFSPNDTCTRAQVVTFLWRAAGNPEPKTGNNPFKDVKPSDYFYKPVLWAVENKITAGTSATTFSPNDGCTRGQVVTFLWRSAGNPAPGSSKNPFTDVKSDAYFYDPVLWAVEHKITAGTSDTTFSPNDTCTRAQIVTFLYRDLGTK